MYDHIVIRYAEIALKGKNQKDFLNRLVYNIKEQIKTDESGYIVADESTRTNLPGVFAIGDIRTKALRQVVTAISDGATASLYAEEYLAETNK